MPRRTNRERYLPVVGGLLALLLVSPAWADRAQALQLNARARECLDAGKRDEARVLLRQAVTADPRLTETYLNLGYLAELEGDTDGMVAGYGQALLLNPAHEQAQARLRAAFYSGRFPRHLPLELLPALPIKMVVDKARVSLGPPDQPRVTEMSLAYTTGLFYPEEMRTAPSPLLVPLPITGEVVGQKASFNRVRYGYACPPGSQEYVLRVSLYYPSATISAGQHDYDTLATALTHLLLRLQSYFEMALPPGAAPPPLRAYLCEAGPLAAEAYEGALYFYSAGEERTAFEWLREAAHELGHLCLPKIGRFTAPEPWGSGHLGERLALQWLADEAGLVAGTPWPSEGAQYRLGALWQGHQLPVADYLAQRCRPLMDAWCQAGPTSAVVGQDDEAALSYLLGCMLWVQAAHGQEVLRETLLRAAGLNPPEYVKSFQSAVERGLAQGVVTVSAGALDLAASRLATPPTEGALRRENLTLAAGDVVALPLYLPKGSWRLSPVPAGKSYQVSLNDQALPEAPPGGFTVTTPAPGWHMLRLRVAAEAAGGPLRAVTIAAVPGA